MTNKKTRLHRGFTLVETLIAIFVLTLAIVGPLVIASKGLQATTVAKDQDTAFYLAQDAVEYVRWARDTNCLQAGAVPGGCPAGQWLAGSGGQTINLTPCTTSNGCYIDSLNNNPTSPATCSGTCPVMYYDPNENYFTYNNSGTNQTLFTRTITITNPSSNSSEASVTVTVTWCDEANACAALPGGSQSISVREDLFNWQ